MTDRIRTTVPSALERVRIEGSIFLRAEYHEAWAYESHGRAERRGSSRRERQSGVLPRHRPWRCSIEAEGEKLWAGRRRRRPALRRPAPDGRGGAEPSGAGRSFCRPPPWPRCRCASTARTAAGPTSCAATCSVTTSCSTRAAAGLSAGVRGPPAGGSGRGLGRANIDFAVGADPPPADPPSAGSSRLSELLLVGVPRLHLATAPASHAWAGRCPARPGSSSKALALMHGAPERKWSVPELAAGASVSRS